MAQVESGIALVGPSVGIGPREEQCEGVSRGTELKLTVKLEWRHFQDPLQNEATELFHRRSRASHPVWVPRITRKSVF